MFPAADGGSVTDGISTGSSRYGSNSACTSATNDVDSKETDMLLFTSTVGPRPIGSAADRTDVVKNQFRSRSVVTLCLHY